MNELGTAVVHVVDDDEAMRNSLRWLIEAKHRLVRTHASAEEFLVNCHPDMQGCLVLDIRMPGISGLDLLRILPQIECDLPVIVITAHGDVPTAVRAMKKGVLDFLQKPFEKDELLACIDKALARNSEMGRDRHAVGEAKMLYASLTPREREVMGLVAEGKSSKVIARETGISVRTVEVHRARMMLKLHAKSIADVVRVHLVLRRSEEANSLT